VGALGRRWSYARTVTITRRELLRDAALPAALAVLGALELLSLRPDGWGYGVALELLGCTLLVFRRVNPLVFATLAPTVLLVMPWVGPQLDEPSVPILVWAVSIYALARWVKDLRGLLGVAVVVVVVFSDYVFKDQRTHSWSDVVFVGSLIAPPYVLGRITRKLAEQKALLEDQQEVVRREAVRAERDRIARELHDVIAHSVSAMVVQTAAAQDLVRTDPEKAERVLADVAGTGRQALAETGRLLHVLRDDADELGLRPAPGLADLDALVDAFRGRGLAVSVDRDEPLPALPAGVDVSAYRIVQEALTNALRYGADRTAALRLSATPTTLSIRASNPSTGAGGQGSGLGLLGMAERVALLGGTLSHGDRGGRFELDATLPLAAP
jgi:signal transduction histidine kinase